MNPLEHGLHYDIPDEIYRADPGLSQSLLKVFGRAKSPAHFQWEQSQPVDENAPARSGIRIGSYTDAALFRVADLGKRFAVWPGERRGKDWTAFKEAGEGRVILNGEEHERAVNATKAVIKHDDASKLLPVCSKQVAAVIEHPRLKLRMKGLIDMLPNAQHCDPLLLAYAFDLKTASDASPEGFAKACWEFGYDIQAAFYMDVLNFLGRDVKNFGFIVVENKPPHLVKIHYLLRESQIIRRARQKYEDWMMSYSNCVKLNDWPGYTASWSEIQYKPWMLRDEVAAGDTLE